jgi:zinc transporter ZupT
MVEPFAGVIGALAISLFEPMLPWALSFAAGAMIHVVVRELVPENSWSHIIGFTIMMALDVGLG